MPSAEQRGRSVLHQVGACLATLTTALPGLALLVVPGFLFYALRCDESCGTPGYVAGWRWNRDAWQWGVQFWGCAVPGSIAALLVVPLLARHRPRAAAAALLTSALAYAAYGAMWITGGGSGPRSGGFSLTDTISHPWSWLPYTVMVLGGALAIWVERRSLVVRG